MTDFIDEFFVWLFLAPLMVMLTIAGIVGYLPMRGWRWKASSHFKSGGIIIFSYPYCLFSHWGLKDTGMCPNCGYYKKELLR